MTDIVKQEVRVRFAPSPTGYLHVGGLRTALFNYLFARKEGGKFILRIEDTDQKRYIQGALDNLMASLKNMGLDYDEGPDVGGPYGPYIQSERIEIYRKYTEKLLESKTAYYCFCSEERLENLRETQRKLKKPPMYDGKCRDLTESEVKEKLAAGIPFVIRLRFPKEGRTIFDDVIRRKVAVDNSVVDDQVLLKSDGFPTYHLANVIDDHLMGISHVIRGEEWLSSVPKHIFLYRALDWKIPVFVHLPLLLNPDRSKLSKRQGDVAVETYIEKGYLPEALINFIALLGWHSADDRELYTLPELEQTFSLDRINKAGAVFDIDKLNWMNGWYIRNFDTGTIADRARPFFETHGIDVSDSAKFEKVIAVTRDYTSNLEEMPPRGRVFYETPQFSEEDNVLINEENSKAIYSYWIHELKKQSEWSKEDLTKLIEDSMKVLSLKGKKFFFPLRLALFGNTHGPDIPTIIDILGRDESIKRLENCLKSI
ncbi:MAG: glutamate--tRNA ligase [Syntrophales bacterium]|jgi:glutamyl-tRNA synthetase|nr:glutamate--tRNA ligase [Syntrophales bacterium]MDY0043626.1 glutamate--tRNA ligase [Syntrophales bacterium]